MSTLVLLNVVGNGISPGAVVTSVSDPLKICTAVPGASAAPGSPLTLFIVPLPASLGSVLEPTVPVSLAVALARPCARPFIVTVICDAAWAGAQVPAYSAAPGFVSESASGGSPFENVATT